MSAQNIVTPTSLTPKPISAVFPSTLNKGSIWKDGNQYLTITNVEGDLVEYGYPHRRDVYYLSASNFIRQFKILPVNHTFTTAEKEVIMSEFKKCLREIKDSKLNDHVYVMLEELGL